MCLVFRPRKDRGIIGYGPNFHAGKTGLSITSNTKLIINSSSSSINENFQNVPHARMHCFSYLNGERSRVIPL